jgi:hypothetical protein
MVVEVLAARVDGGAEDFHIARAPPPTRTVSRMGKSIVQDYTSGNYLTASYPFCKGRLLDNFVTLAT